MKPSSTARDKSRVTRFWPSETKHDRSGHDQDRHDYDRHDKDRRVPSHAAKLDGEMKLSLILFLALLCVFSSGASSQAPGDSEQLNSVLKRMDSAAASFRSTQAEFEWDTYEKVIDEIDDIEKGTIYYRRNGKEIEMM